MRNFSRRFGIYALVVMVLLLAVAVDARAARAQNEAPTNISADQVNTIAKKLYCPVCENITLDVCGTAACADWRDEIRYQLEAGRTEDQIIADFVQRFGDRVVGTPQDSVLRALSLVTPWILIGGVLLLVGRMVFAQQRKRGSPLTAAPPADEHSVQKYHDLLERDLKD